MSASVPAPDRAARFREIPDPSRFGRIPDAAQQIEQAVVSLTRAVLAEGGSLVFGGHPAISPLVAMVAGEYRAPRHAESKEERPRAQVRIYQSDLWRDHAPDSTMLMYHLGMAEILWIPKHPDESFGVFPPEHPGYPRSLRLMRDAMLKGENPAAMVTIGGMEGVIDEVRLYRDYFPGRPIYVLRKTGGASALLDKEVSDAQLDFIDERIDMIPLAERAEKKMDSDSAPETVPEVSRRQALERDTIPYPLIMQTIVEEIATRGKDKDFG